MHKRIAILGSTGSIGTQTLDVISHMPEHFQIEALAAGNNFELLIKQIRQFRPKIVSVLNESSAEKLRAYVPSGTTIYYGEEGLLEVAANTDADFVVSALVGSVGLTPTLAAIKAGKNIGLANKETLVTAGHIVTELVDRHNVSLIPIDSEHSAIYQCLQGENIKNVAKIILTASGGSFRDYTREQLSNVTIEQALNHPNWSMGAKITIDSATMVNKGLEVIEAHWLFQLPYEQIDVIIHPQSIVHSLVEFVDHSVIAQLGNPDMRIPIQYALSHPARMPSPSQPLNLVEMGRLDFRAMDMARYPCLQMAYESGRVGGSMPTVFNAVNEVAVSMFLSGEITFLQIEDIIYQSLEQHEVVKNPSLEEILLIDQQVRQRVREMV